MILLLYIRVEYNMGSKVHYPVSDLPVKWVSTSVVHFKCKSAEKYISVLRQELNYDKKCICDVTPYGIIFAQVERALGEHSDDEDKRFAARCIIRDIVCYKDDIWGWIDDPVLLRMINGISICRYERIFIEMLKFNPLIIVGKGIMYAVLRNGTYGMMEAILDLCEEKIIFIEGNNGDINITNNIIPIQFSPSNRMCSDAWDLLFERHEIYQSALNNRSYPIACLKIKDEVFRLYRPDMCVGEKDTVWDRENNGVQFCHDMHKF